MANLKMTSIRPDSSCAPGKSRLQAAPGSSCELVFFFLWMIGLRYFVCFEPLESLAASPHILYELGLRLGLLIYAEVGMYQQVGP